MQPIQQTTREESHSGSILVLALLLAVLGTFRLLFIRDIPFINDEPLLILRALEDNAKGVITTHGLLGSRGVDYGPFAIWFYRVGLLLSEQIVNIARFKVLFVAGVSGLSLLWVSRLFPSLRSGYAAIALLSPYLWFYGRDLWDNSLVIPLSALAIASHLAFSRNEKGWQLMLSALCATFGVLCHLVFLPVAIALVLHLLLFHRTFLWRRRRKVFLILFISIAFASPYLVHLFPQRPAGQLHFGNLGHALMPMTGARFFTGLGLEYFMGPQWYFPFQEVRWLNGLWIVVLGFTAVAYPIVWYGMWLALREIALYLFTRKREETLSLSFLAVTALALQLLLSWAYQLIPIPNFHSALWFFYFYFLWLALTRLSSERWGINLAWGYSLSLFAALLAMPTLIHLHGGNRHLHYGPTLGNLIEVTEQLKQYQGNLPVEVQAFHPKEFPWSIKALLQLQSKDPLVPQSFPPARPLASGRELLLKYKHPENEQDGRLELVEKEKVF